MITVVGIGADGWGSLTAEGREAVLAADLLLGGERQLAFVPDDVPGERRAWPKQLTTLVDELPELIAAGRTVAVLASGDPLLHGVGATILRRIGDRVPVRVIPAISSFALACARLNWPRGDVELVSATSRIAETVAVALQPGRRIVVLGFGPRTAAEIARVVRERGFGASRLVVLEELGGADERIEESTADAWPADRDAAALHLVALEVRGDGPLLGRAPGLPDDAYEHDGQITKRDVRAITLAALVPVPGQLLWDVGAGSGSVAIEWLRAAPGSRAVAIERDAARAERIARNALTLGVPALRVVQGEAPDVLRRARRRAAGRDLRRRGADDVRPADALSQGAAAGRAARRQRRHGGGRGARRPRAGRAGRAADAHRRLPRRAARRVHRLAPRHDDHAVRAARLVTVHFIGAGPGAPDLITLRAQKLIAASPVVLYAGALVPDEVLAHAPAGARLVDTQHLDLDAIVGEYVAAHERGEDVARLHSGDISIWSAAAEQMRRLDALSIPYDITPGVPAFAAAAAALGRELTLPGVAQTVILTRHARRATPMPPGEELDALAAHGATLVLHLAVQAIDELAPQLAAALRRGRPGRRRRARLAPRRGRPARHARHDRRAGARGRREAHGGDRRRPGARRAGLLRQPPLLDRRERLP